MALIASVIESLEALAVLRVEWDQLALAAKAPLSAPAWVLAFWAAMSPPGASMRVIVVRRGDELVGIFPLCTEGRICLPIGKGVGEASPLAHPGMEEEVAAAIAGAIATLDPRPTTIRLEQLEGGGSLDWAGMLSQAWPDGRGVWTKTDSSVGVPEVHLGDGGLEEWLAGKSGSFRREMRRKQKRLDEAGASFRFATTDSLEQDVGEFLRLHRGRLSQQGGSSLDEDGVGPMLVAAGRELLPEDRFRLLIMEVGSEAVGAQLVLAAGEEAIAWNSGFDDAYAKLSPSMQCILHVLTDAAGKGQRSFSLGPGDQEYKTRFSDSGSELVSYTLVPKGRGYARARGRIAAAAARHAARGRVAAALPQPVRRAAQALRD